MDGRLITIGGMSQSTHISSDTERVFDTAQIGVINPCPISDFFPNFRELQREFSWSWIRFSTAMRHPRQAGKSRKAAARPVVEPNERELSWVTDRLVALPKPNPSYRWLWPVTVVLVNAIALVAILYLIALCF